MLKLRSAKPVECDALSELCMRSKAVWGYDASFMAACRAELTITIESLDRIQIAEIDGRVVGVAEFVLTDDNAHLEKLFVDPSLMRCGAGRALFDWAKRTAAARGATKLTIESDPQAVDFYRCMGAIDGAIDDGTVSSTVISDRTIPRLIVQLQ